MNNKGQKIIKYFLLIINNININSLRQIHKTRNLNKLLKIINLISINIQYFKIIHQILLPVPNKLSISCKAIKYHNLYVLTIVYVSMVPYHVQTFLNVSNANTTIVPNPNFVVVHGYHVNIMIDDKCYPVLKLIICFIKLINTIILVYWNKLKCLE